MLTGDSESEEFLEMVQDNFPHQHVREATRGDNILDLVFSNRENTITNIEIGEALGKSDHNSIRFNINFKNSATENMSIVPYFRRGNFEGLRAQLSTEKWEGISICQVSDQGEVRDRTGRVAGRNGLALTEVLTDQDVFRDRTGQNTGNGLARSVGLPAVSLNSAVSRLSHACADETGVVGACYRQEAWLYPLFSVLCSSSSGSQALLILVAVTTHEMEELTYHKYYQYLDSGQYPDGLSKEEKHDIRKNVKHFVLRMDF